MTHHHRFAGADLERWRISNGLSKAIAADAFGLPFPKWEELISKEQLSTPIADPVVVMILQLYISHPETAPVRQAPDIREFYAFLGLSDTPKDKETFAALIGRSPPSVYRLLRAEGKPGRPLVRWMEALHKLGMSSRDAQGDGSRSQRDRLPPARWQRPDRRLEASQGRAGR
ncbi:hypothetical protein LP419_37520 [Massilia sp. H-1]|nr:hypothetical protein LP419_37520 [Massilia sp. H-1]